MFYVIVISWYKRNGAIKLKRERTRNALPRLIQTMNIYDSSKWQIKRDSILARDKYQCQISKRYGKFKQAELVHHIFPVDEFPEYAYADWNLISLTRTEHNKLHDRDTDELTEAGRQLLIRTARKNNILIPDKYKDAIKTRIFKEKRTRYI